MSEEKQDKNQGKEGIELTTKEGDKLDEPDLDQVSGGVVHEVPMDLRDALVSDPKALAIWESLTPLARNEWICWATFVKKLETRKQHVERILTELKEGMRRPCCWLGCTHRTDKPISPSVQYVLNKQRRNARTTEH